MKRVLLCGAAIAALGSSAGALAQESDKGVCYIIGSEPNEEQLLCYPGKRILVSGSRSGGLRLDDYTGASTVLDSETLEQRQVRDVAEVLRDVPGVAVSGIAGQTQIRLRGSEGNHVLVLVDGIEVSDPFGGEFDFGTLQAEPGGYVEVLRGPQSALYGSDAIGGVVAYQSGTHRGVTGRIEAGTQGTLNGAARYGAMGTGWDVSLSAVAVTTDGEPNAIGGARDIGRDSYTLSGKGSVAVGDTLTLRGVARYIRTEGDYNEQDFDPASPTFGYVIDSPDTTYENEAIYALAGGNLATFDGRWTHDLSAQIADITRDTFGPFGRTSGSEGDRLKASYVSALQFADMHHLTFAADWERERFRNTDPFGFAFGGREEIENVGLVGEYRHDGERFDFSAALRHDINDRFANETTYRIGAGYRIFEDTRLRASIGSGIKNPGFYELFGFIDGRFINNADLRPEKSTSWEVGVDQDFANGDIRLSATWFDSELENEIFTDYPAPTFVATPANRDTESSRKGLELSASARLGDAVSLDAAYTWLDAEEDGVTEVRRPSHIASAALNWTAPDDSASATLVVRHNGAAEDLAFTDPSFIPVRVTLEEYTLVNLAATYRLSERFELFGRVENLLDERYQQVFSFVSPGRSAVLGLRASF